MKIPELLKKTPAGVSFEFFPPKTEAGMKNFIHAVRSLKDFNPLYVSVTCGVEQEALLRTQETVDLLIREKDITVMPHLACFGRNSTLLSEILNKYKEKGIQNILTLRGDLPENGKGRLRPVKEFGHAIDLVSLTRNFETFSIAVAVYPEGHMESGSIERDTDLAKKKIEAGADFAITQMFFDNSYHYRLLERFSRKGISLPVLPGILPMTDLPRMRRFAATCGVSILSAIEKKLEPYLDKPLDMEKAGIDLSIKQCLDLIDHGVKKIHFFTLNKLDAVQKILEAIRPALEAGKPA
ncbi:MAG TPA: methylenetetrahydrofolate reductase [bacterium]|nr:methylenetetrahydrofolate reductase [bacterium]